MKVTERQAGGTVKLSSAVKILRVPSARGKVGAVILVVCDCSGTVGRPERKSGLTEFVYDASVPLGIELEDVGSHVA